MQGCSANKKMKIIKLYFDGYSYDEIAKRAGVSKGTDKVLTTTDQQELLSKFEKVERERIGAGKHEQYVKLVEDLEREMGRK